jgi:hypothetical protein
MFKLRNLLYVLFGLFCAFILQAQVDIVRLHLIDEQNQPVEGVYVNVIGQERFWYSDTIGIVSIPLFELSSHDSLSFVHVSYEPILISLQSLRSPSKSDIFLQLHTDIKVLEEVIVRPMDPTELVKEAIRLIPTLYAPFSISLFAVHADINIYDANDSTSMIYFKGGASVFTK